MDGRLSILWIADYPFEQADAVAESGLPGYLGMDPAGHHDIASTLAQRPGRAGQLFESAVVGQTRAAADARHLATLKERLGTSFRAGLIVHPGETAYRLDDRVAAVPLAVLV